MIPDRLKQFLRLLDEPQALVAMLTWPRFSLTSYRMLRSLSQQGINPRTILDVGANVGQFSVAAVHVFPRAHIYSFEPIPECVERLREIGERYPSVDVFPIAAGAREGRGELRVSHNSVSSSLLQMSRAHLEAFPASREQRVIEVDVKPLDALRSQLTLQQPVLLKIDVQGYELPVLSGAKEILRSVQYAVIETSFTELYHGEQPFPALLACMSGFGFTFRRPIDFLTSPKDGAILQMDALFERTGPETGPETLAR